MAVAHSLQIRTLAARPTLSQGQCCDLKIDNNDGERFWLCRMLPRHTDHRITIEKYNNKTNKWETTEVFTDQEDR